MAATQKSPGSVVQVWLPHPTDEQLRQHAATERRSLSQTIRLAVEDKLSSEDFAGGAAATADDAPASSSRFGSRRGRRPRGGGLMGTNVVDERRLVAAGFILMTRSLGFNHESLWRRDDEPDLTFSDAEAMAWLAEHEKKKEN